MHFSDEKRGIHFQNDCRVKCSLYSTERGALLKVESEHASQEKSDINTNHIAAVEGGRTAVEWCSYCHLLAQLPRLKI